MDKFRIKNNSDFLIQEIVDKKVLVKRIDEAEAIMKLHKSKISDVDAKSKQDEIYKMKSAYIKNINKESIIL